MIKGKKPSHAMEMTGGRAKVQLRRSFEVEGDLLDLKEINSNLRQAFPLESELVGTAVPMAELGMTVDHRLSRYSRRSQLS